MIGATETTSTGLLLAACTYTYDVYGNRLSWAETQGGVTTVTHYAYDASGNAWADLNGSNALVTRRVFGDQPDQVLARESASGTVAYYIADREGSVRAIASSTGAVEDRITYTAFGSVLTQSASTFGDMYQEFGYRQDAVTGQAWDGARNYYATDGRFATQDPISFGGGQSNLYSYVMNGPTDATDPTGMDPKSLPPEQHQSGPQNEMFREAFLENAIAGFNDQILAAVDPAEKAQLTKLRDYLRQRLVKVLAAQLRDLIEQYNRQPTCKAEVIQRRNILYFLFQKRDDLALARARAVSWDPVAVMAILKKAADSGDPEAKDVYAFITGGLSAYAVKEPQTGAGNVPVSWYIKTYSGPVTHKYWRNEAGEVFDRYELVEDSGWITGPAGTQGIALTQIVTQGPVDVSNERAAVAIRHEVIHLMQAVGHGKYGTGTKLLENLSVSMSGDAAEIEAYTREAEWCIKFYPDNPGQHLSNPNMVKWVEPPEFIGGKGKWVVNIEVIKWQLTLYSNTPPYLDKSYGEGNGIHKGFYQSVPGIAPPPPKPK